MTSRPPATGAATAPGIGEVIGWVDGHPVPRELLGRRIAGLRRGPLKAALPAPGTAEARQLARWLTQVILTEVLCETTARAGGLAPLEGPPLDRLAAVELGSINAAAYNGSPWVRAMYEHVGAGAEVPSAWRTRPAGPRSGTHHVRHRLFPDRIAAEGAAVDDLESLGQVDLASLPAALAEAITRHPYGTLVGPVQDALGWHVALATPAATPPPLPTQPLDQEEATRPMPTHAQLQRLTGPLQAARRRTFARWLDRMRAEKVALVPGLEHPGDPRQPDNHHKHC
ncbi:hypothetical protein Nocox_04950 [Nonomuraea coxensis DSM 45129]|uniref:[acyl-carrier-protein] S-malonyltransferase n=1 Tax=Nonomuraea coxensis DSM 45129 TaxID=1122611 RepID=A0ABX8TT19_9ACTN|nr:hypothetical protein [Nonomuraea coxensis]QYC38617.1 hypothetical protein Nocox_04950 [Nonomuraea coxensis DSM 45129]